MQSQIAAVVQLYRWHLRYKVIYFEWNVYTYNIFNTIPLQLVTNWHWVSIDWENSLAPNTNDDLDYWCIYEPLGIGELTPYDNLIV